MTPPSSSAGALLDSIFSSYGFRPRDRSRKLSRPRNKKGGENDRFRKNTYHNTISKNKRRNLTLKALPIRRPEITPPDFAPAAPRPAEATVPDYTTFKAKNGIADPAEKNESASSNGRCTICDFTTHRAGNLKSHFQNMHHPLDQPATCCDSYFFTRQVLANI